jgi:hypothetical protein
MRDKASKTRTKAAHKAEVGGQRPDKSRIATIKHSERRLANEPGRTIKILGSKLINCSALTIRS